MRRLKQAKHFFRQWGSGVLAVGLSGVLISCGGGGGSSTGGSGSTITGVVAAGTAVGSILSVYPVDATTGEIGVFPVAQTKAGPNGAFSVTLSQTKGTFVIQANGGSYTDEATGKVMSVSSPLQAPVALPVSSPVSITPLTSAIVQLAKGQPGGLNPTNVQTATMQLTSYVGFNPISTSPSFVTPGMVTTQPAVGNSYAFALGSLSQYGLDNSASLTTVIQQVAQEAQQGKTLYNSGGGGIQVAVNSDGTTQGIVNRNATTEAITNSGGSIVPPLASSVGNYANNPNNTSGIQSTTAAMANTQPTQAIPEPSPSTNQMACTNRDQILSQYQTLFAQRAKGVQAVLSSSMVTATNWTTTASAGTWGPNAVNYPTSSPPAACASNSTLWQQEFLMAVVNYWVDQNLNYCHHHVPGWVAPLSSPNPFVSTSLRNSSAGSTSGGTSAMTCTANRLANGTQVIPPLSGTPSCNAPDGAIYCNSPGEINSSDPSVLVQWGGYDCSNFSSWYYNFSGIAGGEMPTGIGTQACTPGIGVMLDINASNFDQYGQYLQTGDLLYILDSTNGQRIAHVIVWSGQQWSDLQSNPNASVLYNFATRGQLNKAGQALNRLGGDIASYGPTTEAAFNQLNPWMIVDSHYAGPAYRPFVGWYRKSLSHVRRIINANALPAALQSLVINNYSAPNGSVSTSVDGTMTSFPNVMYSAKYANQPAGQGYRLLADLGNDVCARDGNIANLP